MNDIPEYLKSEFESYKKRLKEAEDLYSKESDPELKKLAEEEIKNLRTAINNLKSNNFSNGRTKKTEPHPSGKRNQDSNGLDTEISGDGNIILEIRAGAGGDEAGLFAADLYRMYQKYAEHKGWRVREISRNEGGIGNIKEIVAEIDGKKTKPIQKEEAEYNPYEALRLESGVHRVQRIPITETGGRVHTSTATVAILPKVSEVEVNIDPKDLRVDTFRSSGKGGQNVNKLETAVRITHIPTGTVVECQEERSQQQNRVKALSVLRARIYDAELQKRQQRRSEDRRRQIGTADRSEKIRTYNFPQNRVTDHRIKKSWQNLKEIMDGKLDAILKALKEADLK